MNGLSEIVIYLLVVLIEVLQPSEPVAVDYVQNLAPVAAISIEPVGQSDNDVYRISERLPAGERDAANIEAFAPIRIEQSDLYAHSYVVYSTGVPARVVDLAEVRRQLAGVSREAVAGVRPDMTLDLADGGGTIHLLSRGPVTLLLAETDSVMLVAQ